MATDTDNALAAMAGTASPMQTLTLRVPAPLLQQITDEADRIHAHRSHLARYLLQLGIQQLKLTSTASRPDSRG
jgi:hypothetical protein